MKLNMGTYTCVWAIVGLLAAGTAWAQSQYGDGSIVGWGWQVVGGDMSQGAVAVAAGDLHNLGLKSDGSIVAWGSNSNGQGNVPEPNTGVLAVAAGFVCSLGLKANGSSVAWGDNKYGQCNEPDPNTDFVAVAGGLCHTGKSGSPGYAERLHILAHTPAEGRR